MNQNYFGEYETEVKRWCNGLWPEFPYELIKRDADVHFQEAVIEIAVGLVIIAVSVYTILSYHLTNYSQSQTVFNACIWLEYTD